MSIKGILICAAILLIITIIVWGGIRADSAIEQRHQSMTNWPTWQLENVARYGDQTSDGRDLAMDLIARRTLNGEHSVRRMLPAQAVREAHLDGALGGAFLFGIGSFAGSEHGESIQKVVVTFAWQMPDGAYAITTLPLEKFRVRLVASQSPTVSFRHHYDWGNQNYDFSADGLSKLIDEVTVTCDPRDWPTDVTLPTVEKR